MSNNPLRRTGWVMPPLTRRPTGFPVSRHLPSAFAWVRPFLTLGLLFGGLFTALTFDVVTGATVFLLFAAAGLVWNTDEIPVLPFCLAYQWVNIAPGYIYQSITGEYPGFGQLAESDSAVMYSSLGLLCVALGIRTVHEFTRSAGVRPRRAARRIHIPMLHMLVIAVFVINWLVQLNPRSISPTGAEIIYRLMGFRYVLLLLLIVEVARRRRGYFYVGSAFLFVLIPHFASKMSGFKLLFFLFLLVAVGRLAGKWFATDRRGKAGQLVYVGALCGAILLMGMVWQSSVKPLWRTAPSTGNPVGDVAAFFKIAAHGVERFEIDKAAYDLLEHISSGTAYFAKVIHRVPNVIPHADGELTWRAIRHVSMPRLLFPDKPALGSDSFIVRKYAGVGTPDDDSGTSIGMGYFGEFYIDFGAPTMFLVCFLHGIMVGGAYVVVRQGIPDPVFAKCAVTIVFLHHFMTIGEIAKLSGGLLQESLAFVVLTTLLYSVGQRFGLIVPAKSGGTRKLIHNRGGAHG